LDEHEGSAWLTVVPFWMRNVAHRYAPLIGQLSTFPELNVRTYVTLDERPGVWFLSLDAPHRAVVWFARRFFHMPYARASIDASGQASSFRFRSRRPGPVSAAFSATYQPRAERFRSTPGTLAHFLTERYCFYARAPRGTLHRVEVHHRPWVLQPATATVDAGALLASHRLTLSATPDLLHFSQGVDVVAWPGVATGR
jgi:uncharacterized protein YqjF (DUF2071 family)